MTPKSAQTALAGIAALLIFPALTGCKPDNIFFSINNKSGGTLHDVKVSYPDGKLSFSTLEDSTSTGTYRHFDGPGRLTVSFTTEDGRSRSSSGPQVAGTEKGQVDVNIDGSYASFDTKFEENQQ